MRITDGKITGEYIQGDGFWGGYDYITWTTTDIHTGEIINISKVPKLAYNLRINTDDGEIKIIKQSEAIYLHI